MYELFSPTQDNPYIKVVDMELDFHAFIKNNDYPKYDFSGAFTKYCDMLSLCNHWSKNLAW